MIKHSSKLNIKIMFNKTHLPIKICLKELKVRNQLVKFQKIMVRFKKKIY